MRKTILISAFFLFLTFFNAGGQDKSPDLIRFSFYGGTAWILPNNQYKNEYVPAYYPNFRYPSLFGGELYFSGSRFDHCIYLLKMDFDNWRNPDGFALYRGTRSDMKVLGYKLKRNFGQLKGNPLSANLGFGLAGIENLFPETLLELPSSELPEEYFDRRFITAHFSTGAEYLVNLSENFKLNLALNYNLVPVSSTLYPEKILDFLSFSAGAYITLNKKKIIIFRKKLIY